MLGKMNNNFPSFVSGERCLLIISRTMIKRKGRTKRKNKDHVCDYIVLFDRSVNK